MEDNREDNKMENFDKLLMRLDRLITFAEAKNAALLVFNTTVLTLMVKLIGIDAIDDSLYYKFIIAVNTISFAIALFSFKPLGGPKTISLLRNHSFDERGLNLLYYADIAKCSDFEQYKELLLQKYEIKVRDGEDSIIDDYTHEIFEDARIAARKYKLFNIAMYINLLMILLLAFILLI